MHSRWLRTSVSGLSTRPRLASVDDPAGVVGCTLTAPHPVSASAPRTTASTVPAAGRRTVGGFLGNMRRTKVEDHSAVLVYGALGGPLPRLGVIAAGAVPAGGRLHTGP